MIRTQIQLTEEQVKRLKELAAASGQSVAQIIRESVDAYTSAVVGADETTRRQRALAIVGRFRSGRDDTSADHDEALADIWQP